MNKKKEKRKHAMVRRTMGILLAAVMIFNNLPVSGFAVFASEKQETEFGYELQADPDTVNASVPVDGEVAAAYQEASWDGSAVIYANKNAENCTPVAESTEAVTWDPGWYVVNNTVTIEKPITVNGDVNLILADGCTLHAAQGIVVTENNSLTIYAQAGGTGTLNATGVAEKNDVSAGIGGSSTSPDSGTITIHGGVINATGGSSTRGDGGAGIGGGTSGSRNITGGTSGAITIYGGTVIANSGAGNNTGAGIGGGAANQDNGGAGSNITIYGGSVTATSNGTGGAGIGGGVGGIGSGGEGSNITICGGTVTATGGNKGAGIGGGGGTSTSGAGTNITISGGEVTAIGGRYAAGIGGGGGYIFIGSQSTTNTTGGTGTGIRITGGIVDAQGGAGNSSDNYKGDPIGNGGNSGAETVDSKIENAIVFVDGEGRVHGTVILDGDYTLPADYSLTIPAGASLSGSGILSGGGTFQTENVTADMISGTEGLVYTGTDYTDQIKLEENVTICGAVFFADITGWTMSIDPAEVKAAGDYTVTLEKEGSTPITTTFTVAECPHTGLVYAPLADGRHGGVCTSCGTKVSEEHTWKDGVCAVCNSKAVAKVESGGETVYYGTIESAWTAAQGKTATLTLLNHVTTNIYLEVDNGSSDITFIGGNYTLTSNYDYAAFGVRKGTLTIESGTIDSSAAGVKVNGGTFKFTGGKVKANSFGIEAVEGTVRISGGEITGSDCVRFDNSNADVKISGGTLTGNSTTIRIVNGKASDVLLNYGTATEPHYAFYQDTQPVKLSDGDTLPSGTYTVQVCMHGYTYTHTNGTAKHTQSCQYCGDTKEDVDCSFTWNGAAGECACGAALNVAVSDTDKLTYDGTAKEPGVTVTLDGTALDTSTYTVAYDSNVNAGNNTASVTVSGTNWSFTKNFTIEKALLTVTAINQEITYGQSIMTGRESITWSELCDGDRLDTSGLTLTASTEDVPGGTITPSDVVIKKMSSGEDVTGNYEIIYVTGKLTIHRAEGTLTIPETSINKKFGEDEFALNCSTNGDGKISYASSNENVASVSADGNVLIKGAGETIITVCLGEGTNHTGGAEAAVTVTVEKAENAPNMPSGTRSVAKRCEKVSDVELPAGWQWDEADRDTALEIGVPVTATAVYAGADKDNYKNLTAAVSITRSNCDHQNKELRNVIIATCQEKGYSGDTYCKDCGELLEKGTETDLAAHSYISIVTQEPTVSAEGVMTYTCTRCGDSYTIPIDRLPDTPSQPGSRPESGKPFIKDEPGKDGWKVIKEETDKAEDGNTVTVDMNGSTVVPGDVLANIRSRDIIIVFDMGNGITWSVNGKNVEEREIGDIDFSVETGTEMIPMDIINNLTGERDSIQISLAHEGEFGFTAVLSINLGKENAGRTASLYYYNEISGELKLVSTAVIAEDGTAGLAFTHASDYVIAIDGNGTVVPESPQTGQEMKNVLWLIVACLIALAGIAFAAVPAWKKREENG